MTYSETLNYLFARLPMFQNIGKAAYKKDLTNTIALLEYLGNPQDHMKWIHVAGTNGKGSTSSMLAAIFTAHGYKTGLYTSPHLVDFRERIRINGHCIEEAFVVDFVYRIGPAIDLIEPSFFEITVAMAFDYFRSKNIDLGIIEVGLGGRLDSTNIIESMLSIITSIGMDHTDILGNTIEEIAYEKAGIAKKNTPIVVNTLIPETALKLIAENAQNIGAPIFYSKNAPVNWLDALTLKGDYQVQNLSVVYTAMEILKNEFALQEEKIVYALSNIQSLTGLRGRWEIVQNEPLTICDTGHNEDGVAFIVNQLKKISINRQIHIIWGMVKDKDRTNILKLLPNKAKYYLIKPTVQRGLDVHLLQEEMTKFGLENQAFSTISAAYSEAKSNADLNDVIFIGGSTFVVGDFLNLELL